MIVLDASALAEYLVGTRVGAEVDRMLTADGGPMHLPHLAVIETASVFRASVARGALGRETAGHALADLHDFPATLHPAGPFLDRVWELRHAVTAYDGLYVALAEALDARLLTLDARLARSHGHQARIDVLG